MVTLKSLKDIRSEDIARFARDGWRWWIGQLAAMMPKQWHELFRNDTGLVTADVLGSEIVVSRSDGSGKSEIFRASRQELESLAARAAASETVKASLAPGDQIVVRVSRAELLTRTVTLPATASRNLKNILKYELERISPLDPAQISFDYRVLRRDKEANRLDVELRILKRQIVDDAVQLARAVGLEPETIGFLGSEGAPDQGFPVSGAASLRGHWRTWRVPALAALAAVLGIGALLASYSRQQAGLDALSAQLAAAKVKAHSVEILQNDIDKAKLGMAFLGRQKQSPLVVEVLAEVTRVLPDRTWLVQFELRGKEVRIEGYSNAASALIARFDNSRLFTNAQFRSSLTKGPAGDLERFDLSAEIKDRAG